MAKQWDRRRVTMVEFLPPKGARDGLVRRMTLLDGNTRLILIDDDGRPRTFTLNPEQLGDLRDAVTFADQQRGNPA